MQQTHQLLPLQEQQTDTDEPAETPRDPTELVNTQKSEETEPNYTTYHDDTDVKPQCNCIFSTKSSSLTLDDDKDLKSICTCTADYEKQMSIINKQSDKQKPIESKTKERHMSVDSARDSGIGENSNFTDARFDESADEKLDELEDADVGFSGAVKQESIADMRGLWQPKIKRSLVERLPEGCFYLVEPSRYIFPGAEVYYDPDEKFRCTEESSSDSSDSESENADDDGSFWVIRC